MEFLFLDALDRRVRVESASRSALAGIEAVYGHMKGEPGDWDWSYRLTASADSRDLDGDLLWEFDGDLAVELQKLRSELFFLHAAVVADADRAYALVAESGGGKSFLCWALLFQACGYSSDELCPVDLENLSVHPFPRALSLKSEPEPPLVVPDRVQRTSRALYVPTAELPATVVTGPLPLDAVFFLRYEPSASEPQLRPISAAAAATRLYVSALNPLAHSADGLDATIRIARACRCYELVSADLVATSEAVARTIREGR